MIKQIQPYFETVQKAVNEGGISVFVANYPTPWRVDTPSQGVIRVLDKDGKPVFTEAIVHILETDEDVEVQIRALVMKVNAFVNIVVEESSPC